MFDLPEPIASLTSKIEAGQRITPAEALVMMREFPLSLLGMLATRIKERKSGKAVYYNRNFHIEPTNICVFNCRFCSYRRPANDPQAWDYSIEEMEAIVEAQKNSGATEIHIVGGVHPHHNLDFYCDLIRRIRRIMPQVCIKAFSAIELAYMIEKSGLTLPKGLTRLKEAGMETMPGGGAEIFAPKIRNQICPEKGDAEQWLEVHRQAHKLGISTNATILYGHIETIEDRIDHLDRLRTLQDETAGFNAFIPLKYRNLHNSMSAIGEVSIVEDMRIAALSRIYLDNFPHIKAYWPMFGKKTAEMALAFGADDMDGTIADSTKIYSMAGAEDKSPAMTLHEMEELIKSAGYIPVERDTFYNPVKK